MMQYRGWTIISGAINGNPTFAGFRFDDDGIDKETFQMSNDLGDIKSAIDAIEDSSDAGN